MQQKLYTNRQFYLDNPTLTNKQLAILAGCSESTINVSKRKLGLTFALLKEPTWDYKKLLDITPESMYWAGFILADGCFSKETTRKIKLSISSSITDEDQIIKFKKWVSTDNTIYYSKDNCCSISVYSKKYIPEIMNFWGMSFRKTYIPYNIPANIQSHEFFKYFIVGLIDGDGSVVKIKNSYKITITQHNSQEGFLSTINNWLGNDKHKIYLSDRDNTANLIVQRKEIRECIKSWYNELGDLPLTRKLNKMI